jgi:hypothetical protein
MTTYSTDLQQAAWVIYINGLEVPFVQATLNWTVGEKPTLQLQLFPYRKLQRLGYEDRLQVAVFYLDTHYDPDNPTFRLLGEFEVVGMTYTNNTRSRSMTFNCKGHLRIFDQLNFFYMSSLNDMVLGLSGPQKTDASGITSTKPFYPLSLFRDGLIGTSEDDHIKRPTDLVTNIFRALLWPVGQKNAEGNELPEDAASVPGKNFFARWLNMTHFHRRWAALPIFEDVTDDTCFPLLKAVQDTTALEALKTQIGSSVGSAGTAWQLLQQVLGYMYLDISPIPAPPAVTVNKGSGRIEKLRPSSGYQDGLFTSIISYTVKPQCMFGIPPLCNVVFPSMIRNFSYTEDYESQPTRLYLGESYVSNLITSSKTGVDTLTQQLLTTAYPLAARERLRQTIDDQVTNSRNFLLFPEEFYKGPVTQRMNAPPWMYLLEQMYKGKEGAKPTDDTTPLGSLFDKYAEYEFFRNRYIARNGGLSLVWNPYVVPGYPVMVFDRETDGYHCLGYAHSVTHSFSAGTGGGSLSTEVSVGFMRSLVESVQQLNDKDSASYGYDVSPVEPIDEVRDVFQKKDVANEFFSRLLHRGAPKSGLSVFSWEELIQFQRPDGSTVSPYADPVNFTDDLKVIPKDNIKGLFESSERALRFVARPACTLQEYVEEYHGERLDVLLETKKVRGAYKSFYSPLKDKKNVQGAVFYGRIYDLVEGPGANPAAAASLITNFVGDFLPPVESWSLVGPETGMPQTREKWSKILEEYRKIVRREQGKISLEV